MALNPRAREPFDRERAFLTVRPVLLSGKSIGPGQPLDKALVNTRRLRQLYDQRMIKMAPAQARPARSLRSPRASPSPNFTQMTDADLRAHLEARGVIPRHKTPRQRLLELARGLAS